MPDQDDEIRALRQRVEELEAKYQALPDTWLLSRSPAMRALSVVFHLFLGWLLIGGTLLILRAFGVP